MDTSNYLEWIGYAGSIIVAISLTMTSMLKLRWLNLLGAVVFTAYGIAIDAMPVALVNGFIIIIDVYYLIKIYTTKDYFKVLEIERDDKYLSSFLDFYDKAIRKEFPQYDEEKHSETSTFLVLRNMSIASVLIGHKQGENTFIIDLDYAIPQYQDFKTGRYLLIKRIVHFKKKGISQLTVIPHNKAQRAYYTKMKFSPIQLNQQEIFTKCI